MAPTVAEIEAVAEILDFAGEVVAATLVSMAVDRWMYTSPPVQYPM